MRKIILTAALVCAFLAAQAQEYYEKQVTFPVGATLEQKVDMASRLLSVNAPIVRNPVRWD